jgi:hypothetical protein
MFVGSGVVEAGCKSIGQRLKLSGMRWTLAGATGIATLRCLDAGDRWDEIWQRPRSQTDASRPRQPGELILPPTELAHTPDHLSPAYQSRGISNGRPPEQMGGGAWFRNDPAGKTRLWIERLHSWRS